MDENESEQRIGTMSGLPDRIDYFALRPHEVFELWHFADHSDPRFLVCLSRTPPLPGALSRHSLSTPFAVLCMARFNDGWGWCTLAANTKELVGNALIEAGAEPEYWFVFVPGSDRKPFVSP